METAVKTDRRILRTKEAIKTAFLNLFLEKEFERITINDISERANINRGTVYLHFLDKYDLLDKCIDDQLNQMSSSCILAPLKREKEELVGALSAIFAYLEEHIIFFSAMLVNQRTVMFRERMLRVITELIQEKVDMQGINQDMDKEMITHFTASAFVGLVEWWIANRMPHPPQIMAEQVWKLFERNDIQPISQFQRGS
ncbi:TetR/AcrR family transcriptional regulator [Paenibacillus sp. 7124]|uniref:TetR/AcrR family transcriptional regulator n=1 Tax=Paenibacillus apii TaxID=1850370 RepID=A0A6M1PGW0_9BACL|nr:TetR/AcrR family transcriptional regulator C-terminal domain-containing protein [Paenibacillus apii]NGM82717.1 TetR/AcrR family transcriptional regulator [Paenibacillus apii]